MPGITYDEMFEMRNAIGELLPDTCTILSPTLTSDAQGGYTSTMGTVATYVSCRLDTVSNRDYSGAEMAGEFTKLILTLPHDTTILNTYQIVHNSITYNIVGRYNKSDSWLAAIRLEIEAATS